MGLTTPERILIDDNGVGLGWDTGSGEGQGNGGRGMGDRYDLLTVVLHEMGHVLGQGHAAADDLMEAILQPGGRYVPAVDSVLAEW